MWLLCRHRPGAHIKKLHQHEAFGSAPPPPTPLPTPPSPDFSNQAFRGHGAEGERGRLYQLSERYKSSAMPREAASFSVTRDLHTSSHSQTSRHHTRAEKWGGCSSSQPSSSRQRAVIHNASVCVCVCVGWKGKTGVTEEGRNKQ